MVWMLVIGGVVVAYLAFRWYDVGTRARCRSDADISMKTVLITGGNTGIGFETAMNLARRHARVIIACRDVRKAKLAVEQIVRKSGNSKVTSMVLDLSSLDSVRQFAEDYNKKEDRLDILINNAGIIGSMSKRVTKDDLELTIGINHFGHFLLTNLLLEKLIRSAPSRVVVLSSVVQSWATIEFSNLNFERSYSGSSAYFNSKLANVLFAKELHRRFHDQGITVFVLHPGSVKTDLLKNLLAPLKFLFDILIMPLFFMSPGEGAQTSIYCAVQEDIEHLSGKYFTNCKVADEGAKGRDEAVAVKLWEISETVTGLA